MARKRKADSAQQQLDKIAEKERIISTTEPESTWINGNRYVEHNGQLLPDTVSWVYTPGAPPRIENFKSKPGPTYQPTPQLKKGKDPEYKPSLGWDNRLRTFGHVKKGGRVSPDLGWL